MIAFFVDPIKNALISLNPDIPYLTHPVTGDEYEGRWYSHPERHATEIFLCSLFFFIPGFYICYSKIKSLVQDIDIQHKPSTLQKIWASSGVLCFYFLYPFKVSNPYFEVLFFCAHKYVSFLKFCFSCLITYFPFLSFPLIM